MLVTLMAAMAAVPAPGETPAEPVRIDILARPCRDDAAVDVTVCARPRDDYRIDPSVLGAQRARNALPIDTRSPQERSQVADCTRELTACQGGGVIPVLPAAVRIVSAAVLAAKGKDWRQAFRDKPGEYELYQAEQAQRKSRISVGVRTGSGIPGPR